MSDNKKYQYDFSEIYSDASFNKEHKLNKAKTICAILKEQYGEELNSTVVLDVGVSTGYIADYISDFVDLITAIDIDKKAISFAKNNFNKKNLTFEKGNVMELEYSSESFDIVICNHIYEHVPNDVTLMKEIFRVLKKGGICYFAAGNRICINEPHYNLPLLSVVPKSIANIYLRILKRGSVYYEKHRTYWGLKKLVNKFAVLDYTPKIINYPDKYYAEYMIKQNSMRQKIAVVIIKYLPWLCPSYIWILKKD